MKEILPQNKFVFNLYFLLTELQSPEHVLLYYNRKKNSFRYIRQFWLRPRPIARAWSVQHSLPLPEDVTTVSTH